MFSATSKLTFIKIILGPVLLIQGWWVRKKTPLLPEPVMQSSGVCGQGSAFSLLLIGDSSAAGVGVHKAEQSLLGQLLLLLSQTHQVTYKMLAKTGKTSREMSADLRSETTQHYDLVVTALGVNDVTAQVPISQWQNLQQHLILVIQEKFTPKQIIMSGLPPVGSFPALSWPLNAYMGAYADQLDLALQFLLERKEQVTFLSLRGYPKTAEPAIDGFHPGPVVYQMWAQNTVDTIDIF